MMNDEPHLNQLRRLRVMQSLQRVAPSPMGEIAILTDVQTDPELSPTIDRVRQSLKFLEGVGFVEIISLDDSDWMAGRITNSGLGFLTTDQTMAGIYSPAEIPEAASRFKAGGRVSSITMLPTEVKAWLDQELVRRQFTGYIDLADLLDQQGYEISKSAIGRYGKKFKDEQKELKQSIEMAKAFASVVGDDGAAMNQTLTALAQQELMTVIRNSKYDDGIKLPELVRSIASLNRSDINTRKFQIEQAARNQALNEAADAVESAAMQKGLSADQAQFWREQVLGVKQQ